MLATPYVACLRIYEPLDSFDEHDRLRWEKISKDSETIKREQINSLERLIPTVWNLKGVDGAHIIDRNDFRYVAPWSTAQRCADALEEFERSLPSSVIPMFLPQVDEGVERENGLIMSQRYAHILSTTWMIPPRWFALFSPAERLRGHNVDGAFTIMRAEIHLAKERCIFAHRTVQKAFGSGPVEEELSQLLNWLNIFDSKSIVECDYGGLAVYLEKSLKDQGESGLEADTSIEDVLLSLEGLSSGDSVLAGRGYERLVSRWRRVAAFEQAM
jgi:hypothetical protein